MTTFSPSGMADIYALKIEPEEIIYLVKEMSRLHNEGEEPDWYMAVLILKDRYEAEDIHVQAEKLFCITERMRCLLEMTKDKRMRGWSMQAIEKDCLLTNHAVFSGTALCTLKRDEDRKRGHFDPDEFFNIVLQESESQGRA